MGWKNIKEHYRIGHQVQVNAKGICIGSAYIHDLIVIAGGAITKRYEKDGVNADLERYMDEMDADPEMLRQLAESPDSFTASIPVYTYDGGDIIEEQCEQPGWPNATHAGHMQYENTYSTDKAEVVKWAKRNADLGIKFAREHIAELEKKLVDARARLASEEADRAKLEAAYPSRANAGAEERRDGASPSAASPDHAAR